MNEPASSVLEILFLIIECEKKIYLIFILI